MHPVRHRQCNHPAFYDILLPMQCSQYAQSILELDGLLESLRPLAESCGVSSPEHENWYALLKHKLVPQLNEKPFLLVAIMGGTNTGKSTVFNHLAGEAFSAVDYRASGTKHPVCLVPKVEGITSFKEILARHFDTPTGSGFHCTTWSHAEQPLELSDENYLFWVEGKNVPERLLLLDTPDFDADRETNWERAKSIRHVADVVIAVLTEQKYNDAAVRRFFREAAEAQKPIIVLFNMIDLDGDLPHLSLWLEQFCRETGAQPVDVLAAPYKRDQSETLNLTFYAVRNNTFVPVDLKAELSELHFDTIKTRTLLGAIKVLDDPKTGVQSYLDTIQQASAQFAEALETLNNIDDTEIQWSGLPASILADEIRTWWNSHRPAWSQAVNSVYRKVGGGLLWSIRQTINYFKGDTENVKVTSLDDFIAAERRTVIEFIGKVVSKLETLADTNNPILRREISQLTSGEHRAELLHRAYSVLESLPLVNQDFRELLHQRLSNWTAENPKTTACMLMMDNVISAAHPLITVTLAVSGLAVVTPIVAQVAVGAAAMAVGESAMQAGSEGIAGRAANLFRHIQEDYVLTRSKRFAEEFHKELWQEVMSRLQPGALAAESDIFKRCRNWNSRHGTSQEGVR